MHGHFNVFLPFIRYNRRVLVSVINTRFQCAVVYNLVRTSAYSYVKRNQSTRYQPTVRSTLWIGSKGIAVIINCGKYKGNRCS
jgi:hypothetical protein